MNTLLMIGLIVGGVTGVAITYLFLNKGISEKMVKQKESLTEELERSHQSRLQITIESLKAEYEKRVAESIQKQELETQKLVESLEEQHENHLIRVTEELQQNRNADLQKILDEIHQDYQSQVEEITHELERTKQSKLREEVKLLREQYEAKIQQLTAELQQLYANQGQEYIPPAPIALPDLTPPPPRSQPVASETISPEVTSIPAPKPIVVTTNNHRERIIQWGQSQNLGYLPKLIESALDPDAEIRELTATALGQIAQNQGLRAEITRLIPLLGKMSQDLQASVRKSAIMSLAVIPSDQVIPFLERALHDPDHQVVQAASTAIRNFKFYRPQPTTSPRQEARGKTQEARGKRQEVRGKRQ